MTPMTSRALARLRPLLALTLLASASVAGPGVMTGTPYGTPYGEAVGAAPAVAVADLVSSPHIWEGRKVRVEGVVTDVCPKRCCWMTFVVPMGAKGKWTVAEGIVRRIELTLERTRDYLAHLAMEKGESFDPASVTEPKVLVKLEGAGAVIRDLP